MKATGSTTPRDKLDKLLAFSRRALRYWWLVALVTIVGGALSALLALASQPRYMSEARLLYNERISSTLLQGHDVIQQTRNLGNRYREMLMARQQLAKVVAAFGLFGGVVAEEGMDAAIEELEEHIDFRIRGTGMFHIQVIFPDPALSQGVARMLTDVLIAEDLRVRRESASATKNFLLEEKDKASQELSRRMKSLAAFLAEHPEFAEDVVQGPQAATGAGIRAATQGKVHEAPIPGAENMQPELLALERQRRRLRARLAVPEGAERRPVETPEMREAREAIRDAKRDLVEAQRRVQRLGEEGIKPAHPDMVRAMTSVAEATKRLAAAAAALPAAPPRVPIDREALKKELQEVERQIASARARLNPDVGNEAKPPLPAEPRPAATTGEEPENWVVALETEFARLTQEVEEARRRVNKLDTSLSSAEIAASQQMAEEGAVLTVIDPANRPGRPQGKGRLVLFAAGLFVFVVLGAALALCLALVDDRIYTAGDLEELGIAPVMVVIPRMSRRRRARHG